MPLLITSLISRPGVTSFSALGVEEITLPFSTSALNFSEVSPTARPTPSSSAVASSSVLPFTFGTATISRPLLTISVTVPSFFTSSPPAGLEPITVPSATLSLNSSRTSACSPCSTTTRWASATRIAVTAGYARRSPGRR